MNGYLGPEENSLAIMHHDGNDSDSLDDDSDAKKLFDLPARKIIRPNQLSNKQKFGSTQSYCWKNTNHCLKSCCTWVAPLLFAMFIVSTSLCLLFLLSGMISMKQELRILKAKLKNTDDIEMEFNAKNEKMRMEYETNMNSYQDYRQLLENFSSKIKSISDKFAVLNSSLIDLQSSSSSKLKEQVSFIKQDLDTIKSGMADTGSDIEQLKGQNTVLDEQAQKFKAVHDEFRNEVSNIAMHLSELEKKPILSFTSTPKTLLVKMTPDEDNPMTRKDLNKALQNYISKATFQKESENFKKELKKMFNDSHFTMEKVKINKPETQRNKAVKLVSATPIIKNKYGAFHNNTVVITTTASNKDTSRKPIIEINKTIQGKSVKQVTKVKNGSLVLTTTATKYNSEAADSAFGNEEKNRADSEFVKTRKVANFDPKNFDNDNLNEDKKIKNEDDKNFRLNDETMKLLSELISSKTKEGSEFARDEVYREDISQGGFH